MTGYIDANTFGNVNVYVHRNGNIITCIIVVGIVGICRGYSLYNRISSTTHDFSST